VRVKLLQGPESTQRTLSHSIACNSWKSYTYCTSSRRRAVYFWKQDSQSYRRTSKHHWRACRSSTLYAVSTSYQTDGTV